MNSKLIPSISLNVIGTYRAQLMGIAMLNVMMLHSLSWLSLNLPKSVVFVMGLLFTEGFLFLSGFGLYYSFYKNSNLKQFYGKRVQRLLIPYWIITTPFFVVQVTNGDYGYFGFIQRFFTIAFWTHGNYAGLWYISVSVLLYLCFPLIFRGLQKRYIGGGIIILLLIVISVIYYIFPEYYQKTSIGIVKLPYFVMGAWAGKLSIENKTFNSLWIVIVCILIIGLSKYPICSWLSLNLMAHRVFGIFACVVFLMWTSNLKGLHKCLAWVGKYTLEHYCPVKVD